MAERYGEKPKHFTGAWFEYVWDYYKWIIIAVCAAVGLIFFTVRQAASTPQYDITLTAAGNYLIGDAEKEKLINEINRTCSDINGDVEVKSDVYSITYTGDANADAAYDARFILQLQEDDMLLYIMDRERFDEIIAQSFGDETFTPLSEWYDGDADENDIYSSGGTAYGVKLKASNKFSEFGGEYYLAVRKNYRNPEETEKLYTQCKKTAKTIMEDK